MYFRDTEIVRAERMVENLGYVAGKAYDGPEYSFVTFYDPHTLHPDWKGPVVPAGKVEFTPQEIAELRHDPNAKAIIFAKVRAAIDRLSENIKNPTLKGIGISLSFMLLCWYPVVGRLF